MERLTCFSLIENFISTRANYAALMFSLRPVIGYLNYGRSFFSVSFFSLFQFPFSFFSQAGHSARTFSFKYFFIVLINSRTLKTGDAECITDGLNIMKELIHSAVYGPHWASWAFAVSFRKPSFIQVICLFNEKNFQQLFFILKMNEWQVLYSTFYFLFCFVFEIRSVLFYDYIFNTLKRYRKASSKGVIIETRTFTD